MATANAEPTLLDRLRQERAQVSEKWGEAIDAREQEREQFEARLKDEDESKRPSQEERDAFELAEEEFRARNAEFKREFEALDERVDTLQQRAERRQTAEREGGAGMRVEITHQPAVYRRDNAHEVSYFKDLVATNRDLRGAISRDWAPAEERLEKHGREQEERLTAKETEAKRAAEAGVEHAEAEFRKSSGLAKRGLDSSPFELRASGNPSRATGAGGEFVPPLWLVEDDWIPYLRAGRVVAPLCRNLPVPPGTDTIKLPKIKLGSEVAPQLEDNAGVASRNIETEYVEAAVKTLAGQEDVAIQLIEQSPGQVFDRVVQEDLLADYNLKVDKEVIQGAGTEYTTLNAGTIRGILETSGKLTNEATEGESVAGAFINAMNSNWSQIARKRYNVQNVHHVANPARAAWFASQQDGAKGETGRLVANATDFPNFNVAGLLGADTPAEGLVLRTPLGPGLYQTVNMPQTFTKGGVVKAGEEYDALLSAKFDDVWFFESDLRTRVLPEVLSGTLQVRFQVYAYIALLVRYGPSVVVACGKPFEKGPKVAGASVVGNFTF